MKKCLALLILITQFAHSQVPADIRKEIEAFEVKWHNAYVQHNPEMLKDVLAEEFISVGSSGKSVTKSQAVTGLIADSLSLYAYSTPYDLDIRLYSNNQFAVVIGRTKETWVEKNDRFKSGYAEYRWTDNLEKRNGKWVCVSAQVVRLPQAEEPYEGAVKTINDYLSQCFKNGQFNGSVLVAKKGNILYKKGFGMANYEWRINNAPDTKFRVGSTTKSFTALLILQLVQEGKLTLDAKLCDLLPAFNRNKFGKITIDHLLRHTAGFPDYNSHANFFNDVHDYRLSDTGIIRRISEYDLLSEAGTMFNYSNDGYILLGAIIEKVTGKPYETVLKEKILIPCGMVSTGYPHQQTIITRMAKGYRRTLIGAESAQYYRESSASGIYSTVEDIFFRDLCLYSEKLLSKKYKDMMWQAVPSGNAYGWKVGYDTLGSNRRKTIRTDGAVYGFFARSVRIEEDSVFVVLLSNERGSTNYLPDIEKNILKILYGQAYTYPAKAISFELLRAFLDKGLDSAIALYDRLQADKEKYSFAENELNNLGYLLLSKGSTDAAIRFLQLNTQVYPHSSNAFDSLAEAFETAGNKKEAILNYQKAVELNKSNAHAIKRLEQLR